MLSSLFGGAFYPAVLCSGVDQAEAIQRAALMARREREEQFTGAFLADVKAELERARAKFPGDRIMTIAFHEEAGELTKALLDEPAAQVWREAVQTAVMAARVAIEGDSSLDEWRKAKGLDNHRCGRAAQ
ncbi:MAG: hypothetical protein ACLP7P_08430 [Rhodomicrobium sp.]